MHTVLPILLLYGSKLEIITYHRGANDLSKLLNLGKIQLFLT